MDNVLLLPEGDGLHECESHAVQLANVANASFVDSAEGNIGCGSGEAEAKSPAGLVEFLSAFVGTLLQLILASFGSQALVVLSGALVFQTLFELRGLGSDECNQDESYKENFHCVIDY